MTENHNGSRASDSEYGGSHLTEILAGYIDRLNSGEMLHREDILREEPELGEEILEQLQFYQAVGAGCIKDEPLGTLGDYTLRRQIGRGGMGVVYEAWEGSMDRVVALKVLPAGIAADDRSFQRFMQEAKTAGKLSHQNIVPVYSTGIKEGTPWFSMEFVKGETLAQVLARFKDAESETETPFGAKDEVAYFHNMAKAFADVADGLQHAHSKGVTHRDIKPSNLILDSEGRLRILDFGLARLEGQESLTLSGDFVGTPLYMSPEQARRKKIPVDHRTDVYSLGATMYEALTGRPPFRGRDHADTLSQIIDRDPIQPRKLNLRVPKDLETIVLKCLRKDSGDRYGTAEALGQDLRRFVRGDPVEARPEGRSERLFRCMRRRRVPLLVVGALLILGLIVVGLVLERRQLQRKGQLDRYELTVRALIQKLRGGQFRYYILERQALDAGVLAGRAFQLVTREDFRDVWRARESFPADEAVRKLQEIVDALPEKRDGHFHLARAYLALDRPDDARRELRQTLECDRGFVPARVLTWDLDGVTEGEKRARLDELTAEYASSSAWEGDWIRAHRHFAYWRHRPAAEGWSDVIERCRESGEEAVYLGALEEAYLWRGLAHLREGRWVASQTDFAAARGLGSELAGSLLLAKSYFRDERHNQREDAERILRTLHQGASLLDRAEVALWVVALYNALGDFQRALDWTSELGRATCRERLESYFYLRVGRVQEAIVAGSRAAERNPRDPVALFVLGKALLTRLLSQDSPEKAVVGELLRIAKRAVVLEGDSTRYRSLLWIAERLEQGNLVRKGPMKRKLLNTLMPIATALIPFTHTAAVDPISVVVPNAYADQDSPGGPCCDGFEWTPFREQLLLPADQFGALSGPCWVTGISFRPDGSVHGNVPTGFDRIEFRMSTCRLAELTADFEANHGEDQKTVFEGSWEIENVDDGSRPRPWSHLDFEREKYFFYDPSEGNLLLDVLNHSGWRSNAHLDADCWLVSAVSGGIDDELARCHIGVRGQPGCSCIATPVTRVTFQPVVSAERFRRGDCNDDGNVDISDAVFSLGALFLGDGDPSCDDACDSNDDGAVDISDPIATLGVLFLGNGVIPLPGMTECGVDPTDDQIGCETFERCP